MKIGYARVSTKGQSESLETQRGALEAAGCARVFEDTISGAKSARPGLKAALDYMRDDDVLVVTRLDRLGRTALDTRTKEGRLMVTIMSGLAEFERDLLIERTKEGVAHARAEGRVAGPKPKLSAEQVRLAGKAVESGESVAAVARSLGVSRQTVYRALDRPTGD